MKETESKAVFVTEDKWVLNNGVLDEIDVEALKEASPDGKPLLMNTKEMLEHLQEKEPEKFDQLMRAEELRAGIRLTSLDQFLALTRAADTRYKEFDRIIEAMMLEQARLVRKLRVDMRHSWRAVAREVYNWGVFKKWQPPSNQLAGMALCDRAAKLLGENYREEPWN